MESLKRPNDLKRVLSEMFYKELKDTSIENRKRQG
jgi:hypothetical protein